MKAVLLLNSHPERNEFRTEAAAEVFEDNVVAFAYKVSTGFLFLGMYTNKEAIEMMRTLFRDKDGTTLL